VQYETTHGATQKQEKILNRIFWENSLAYSGNDLPKECDCANYQQQGDNVTPYLVVNTEVVKITSFISQIIITYQFIILGDDPKYILSVPVASQTIDDRRS
jgi:hypothetical protein